MFQCISSSSFPVVPIFFHNFPLVQFFFFIILLLFPSPGTHYYKNDCNKSAIPISVKKRCRICNVYFVQFYLKFFVHVFSMFPFLQTLMDIQFNTHTQILPSWPLFDEIINPHHWFFENLNQELHSIWKCALHIVQCIF